MCIHFMRKAQSFCKNKKKGLKRGCPFQSFYQSISVHFLVHLVHILVHLVHFWEIKHLLCGKILNFVPSNGKILPTSAKEACFILPSAAKSYAMTSRQLHISLS